MKTVERTWITELRKEHYTLAFLFNLAIWAIIYRWLGWEWFWVIVIADITRDIGMILKKIYEPKK